MGGGAAFRRNSAVLSSPAGEALRGDPGSGRGRAGRRGGRERARPGRRGTRRGRRQQRRHGAAGSCRGCARAALGPRSCPPAGRGRARLRRRRAAVPACRHAPARGLCGCGGPGIRRFARGRRRLPPTLRRALASPSLDRARRAPALRVARPALRRPGAVRAARGAGRRRRRAAGADPRGPGPGARAEAPGTARAAAARRRHLRAPAPGGGPWRTALRHALVALAWSLGVDRARVAAWVRR